MSRGSIGPRGVWGPEPLMVLLPLSHLGWGAPGDTPLRAQGTVADIHVCVNLYTLYVHAHIYIYVYRCVCVCVNLTLVWGATGVVMCGQVLGEGAIRSSEWSERSAYHITWFDSMCRWTSQRQVQDRCLPLLLDSLSMVPAAQALCLPPSVVTAHRMIPSDYIYLSTYIYICTYEYIYIYIYAHTYIYIYIDQLRLSVVVNFMIF